MLAEEGKDVADKIILKGGKAAFRHMNVSNWAEVKQTFTDIQDKFQKIDVLVNNAGIAGVNKPTHEITEEEWDRVINVNVKGKRLQGLVEVHQNLASH